MSDYSISLPSTPAPSSPKSSGTNTLTVTSLPKSFFHPLVLDALRSHFATFGEINQWVPLPGFGRIIIVFVAEDHAEAAKQHSDPIIIQNSSDGSRTTLRVYRADRNPLIPQDAKIVIPEENYLQPPAVEKNFLISPPGSPPVGWEPIKEEPPNSTPLADDLISALRKLQAHEERGSSAVEILLDPEDGSGVGVYVQGCDGGDECDPKEEDWIYGQPSPARNKWRPAPAALPPMRT